MGLRILRAAGVGIVSVAETTPKQDMREEPRVAIVYANFTTLTLPDGDDVVDAYVQTTYDGQNWVDRACFHFTTADNGNTALRIIVFGEPGSGDDIVTPTDGALADNTDAAVPLGLSVRIKVLIEGATAPSYAYTAVVFYRK